MSAIYKPYIARVAYFVVGREHFDEIVDVISEHTNEYSYRELCNGEGYYVEVEPQVIEGVKLPYIEVDDEVDIIQIWGE